MDIYGESMSFTEKLRKSYRPVTDEQMRLKRICELDENIKITTTAVVNTVKIMAASGEFEIQPQGERRIHFYKSIGLGMSFDALLKGKGFFHGENETQYSIVIDLENEELQYFFNNIKNEIEKNGIIVKGPFIASDYSYEKIKVYKHASYPPTLIKKCTVSSSKSARWRQWGRDGIQTPSIRDPYAPLFSGDKKKDYATDYIPVFEVEIVY